MADSGGRPWPKLNPVRQFGPIFVVLALLAGVGAIATVKADGGDEAVQAGPTGNGGREPTDAEGEGEGETDGGGGYGDNDLLPVTYADAEEAGTLDDYDWGEQCDTETGRIKMPSVYAVPCVPVWGGAKPWTDRAGTEHADNGGETTDGVTAEEIKVVYYVASPQDLSTTFEALGVLDGADATFEAVQDVIEMGNAVYETYGRKVVLEKFQASGDGKTPGPAQADAIKVAQTGAFASIGGPTQTAAYQEELAKQGVLCISCGQATPDSSYQQAAPYAWGTLASPDQLVNAVLDFGVKNLFGQPARFAGDESMRDRERAFGIVHYDQDPPVFGDLEKEATERLEAQGYKAEVNVTYLLNLDTLPAQAQTIIGKLKAANVTSVVFLGDPLMPKFLTEQATKQNYFPEWIITGTVFTDSTAAARLYDPQQWAHAFGASSLPARTDPKLQEPQRLYNWYFGRYPEATKSLPIQFPIVTLLFTGIHMAGPELTAETFAGGLFSYPPSGGGPTTPLISYGFHQNPDLADYTGVDDITTVWWDAEVEGPSEQGVVAKGMWTYPLGGKRFPFNDLPTLPDTGLFQDAGSVTLLPDVPEADQTPDYPPWPDSPAAG